MEPKSYIIPDDIFEEVNAVTHELIRYENPNNLNWMPSYQDVLNQMGKGNQYLNHRLLTFVVRRISELGYDINDHPFKLTRYR